MLRVRVILISVIAVLSGAPVAWACLWDRDTLAAEAKGVPGVIEVIVGRFERNPPLYYQMRLDRVTKQVEANPGVPHDLSLYDDAGVACDRLGRGDEAIEWMRRKRERMDGLATPDKEHEYRYYANLGTFHAHRWFTNGANREDMSDLELARDLIRHAIELNPDAHFGREKYQMMFIEWVIEKPMTDQTNDRKPIVASAIADPAERKGGARGGVVKGLAGLIALGAAWESIDVLRELRDEMWYAGHSSVALMIEQRMDELKAAGRSPVFGEDAVDTTRPWSEIENTKPVAAYYDAAREAAERWHARRTAFMASKLERGEHPDTQAAFWAGWNDEPKLPPMPGSARSWARPKVLLAASATGLVLLGAAMAMRRRRRAAAARSQAASV